MAFRTLIHHSPADKLVRHATDIYQDEKAPVAGESYQRLFQKILKDPKDGT